MVIDCFPVMSHLLVGIIFNFFLFIFLPPHFHNLSAFTSRLEVCMCAAEVGDCMDSRILGGASDCESTFPGSSACAAALFGLVCHRSGCNKR